MALCHTIITEEKENEIIYNVNLINQNNLNLSNKASSPDELALVNFAKYCGIEYLGSDEEQNMMVSYEGVIHKYKLLNVLEFNSSRFNYFIFLYFYMFFRKRQSVIVQDKDKKILLYCKGADSILEKRMKSLIYSILS